MSSLPSDFLKKKKKDIILVEKIDIYLFKLFVRIYLLLYDCNLMLSDGEYNLLTYLQQARRHRAYLHIYLHAILLMSTVYFRVIVMVDCDLPVPGGQVEE